MSEDVKFCGKCGREVVGGKEKELSKDFQITKKDLQVSEIVAQSFPKSESSIAMKLVKFFAIGLVSIAIIGILSGLVIVALSGNKESSQQKTEQDKSWQTYNSATDQFSIDVPSYPSRDSKDNIFAETGDTNDTYSYHFYTSKSGNISFFISKYIFSYQIDVSNEDQVLEKMLNNFISGSGGKLMSSNYTYYSSYRALDFLIEIESESKLARGRILLVGQTPYLLIYEYPALSFVDTDYQKFINSFEIK